MITELVPLDQVVLHNNKEIYERICEELKIAKSTILIATAWFTDPDLFAILENRLKDGISIELIIADNEENLRLDFASLEQLGAIVTKIKAVGYGMMHEKFCVIDNKIAMHGSYNWTLNARKNNNESIIVTNHENTIQSLINNFGEIIEKQKTTLKTVKFDGDFAQLKENRSSHENQTTEVIASYETMLDKMIAAEVSAFDRETLRKQGFERAKSNNGDHQVLYKGLDTLYSGFINDIDVVEDKKRRLLSKIEEQFTKTSSQLKEENELQLATQEVEFNAKEQNIKNVLGDLNATILINKNKEREIKSSKIAGIESNIREIESEINNAEKEFIKPRFRFTEFIPISIISLGLVCYIFFFYSSAAYILLFSTRDAQLAKGSGQLDSQAAQLFDSSAISKAWDMGGSSALFILLFTLIPLGVSLIPSFNTKKIESEWEQIRKYSVYLAMLIIDFMIAYKVSDSITQVNKLKGVTEGNDKWYSDTNFFLVFILGTGGLLLFSSLYKKLISIIQERNPNLHFEKNQIHIKQQKIIIKDNESKIQDLNLEITKLENESICYSKDIEIKKSELEILPISKAYQNQTKKVDLGIKIQKINSITEIFKTHVENDNVPISTSALKDRINVFLEGWNDYLHQEYAISKASDKSKQAIEVANSWEKIKFSEKIEQNIIR